LTLLTLTSFLTPTATTALYTLSLHDALPISTGRHAWATYRVSDTSSRRAEYTIRATPRHSAAGTAIARHTPSRPNGRIKSAARRDRKSTRLNSSHVSISYAVFCLKKKKKENV